MKVFFKNQNHTPSEIKSLIHFLNNMPSGTNFWHKGLLVEIDPTIDCKANNALIRWVDLHEGFGDKVMLDSLDEFITEFTPIYA